MKLEKGKIYSCEYTGFREDRNPTIIVLYSGSKYTHAINLNYLKDENKNNFIQFITNVAINKTKNIREDENSQVNTYSLYHNYLKRKLPAVIKIAYRTYFTRKIKNKRPLHPGFFLSIDKSYKEVVKVSIKKALDSEYQNRFAKLYNKLSGKSKRRRIIEDVDKYFESVQKVINTDIKSDKYTGLSGSFRKIRNKNGSSNTKN